MALIAKNFGSNNAYTVQLEWEPTAQIVESNVTNVHLKCSIKSNRSGASFNGEGRTDTLTVNEISYSIPHGSYTVPGGGSVTFWEYDIAVSHDSDGSFNSKPISCAVNIDNTFSSSGHIGIVTPSGTMTLTTIPRASTMSISGTEIGKPVTFTISAASANFTHSLTYEFGGATGTIISYAKAGTYTWTPPASLVEKCTDAKSKVVKYKLYTWSGTASAIGTKDFEATLSVPTSYAPNVTDGWATATPYNADTAASDIAAFVQGYSRALIEFNPSKIELHGGATIKGYKISYAGVTNSAAPHTTGVLNGTSAEITCTVEDTRGYTASAVLNVSVYPYSNPKLTDISLYRSDPGGAADSAGSCIYAKATLVYSDIGGLNECPLNAYYRLQGGDYGSAIALSSAYGSVITDLAPATNTYVAKIEAKDSLGNSVFHEATIPTDKVAFHLAKGGKGAAFGKYCEADNLLEVDWNFKANGNATIGGQLRSGSFIVENANAHIRADQPILALQNRDASKTYAWLSYWGNKVRLRSYHANGSNFTSYEFPAPTAAENTYHDIKPIQQKIVNMASYSYTWAKAGGVYYATLCTLASLGLSSKTIIGVRIRDWSGLGTLYMPYASAANLGVMAMTNTNPTSLEIVISYI